MKKQLASFHDFLKTGKLGAVSPDMTMAEIVEVPGAFNWKLLSGGHYLALAERRQTPANEKGARRPL